MTIDQPTLARRLKEARERAVLTQEQVAEAVGLSRTAVAQIEGAKRAVSSLELAKLADLYGEPIERLFREESETSQPALARLAFRALSGVEDDPQVQRRIEAAIALCEEGSRLESFLGREERVGPPAYNVPRPSRKSEAVQQGIRVAFEERKRLELGDAPIADMADLIAGQQIWTSGADLPDEISGLFLNDPEIGLVILVNYLHVRARKRFSYAHEYAHALIDRADEASVSRFENRADLREVRANAFAAAFLMPRGGVNAVLRSLCKGFPSRTHTWVYDQAAEEDRGPAIQAEDRVTPGSQTITYKDIATLAFHFGVSYKAAAYRVRNVDLLNLDQCEELIAQEDLGREYLSVLHLSDYEERDKRPDRELRSQVTYLAIEAFRRDQISSGRLLEMGKKLEIPGEQLLRLARG